MNIFDVNKAFPNSELPIKPPSTNQISSTNKEEVNDKQLLFNYLNGKKNKHFNGTLINNSDSELIANHLEQFLPSDSLRLEIQIDRLSDSLKSTQDQLKTLSLLPDSEVKLNQQKALLEKRQQSFELLNQYKQEYREISPIHKFALWVKDQLQKPTGITNLLQNTIYGDKAVFLNKLKNATTSLQLLTNQLESIQTLPGNDEIQVNMIDVLKQYEKIETEVEKSKQNYYQKQPPDIVDNIKKTFQRWYYGYEIPKKY